MGGGSKSVLRPSSVPSSSGILQMSGRDEESGVDYSRVECFLREKMLATCHVVVDCYGTPNPKFNFVLLLFHLAQGLARPQKILPVTLK